MLDSDQVSGASRLRKCGMEAGCSHTISCSLSATLVGTSPKSRQIIGWDVSPSRTVYHMHDWAYLRKAEIMLDIVTKPDLRCLIGALVMWSNCKPRTSMQPAAADRAKSELSKQVRRECRTHSEHLLDFQLAICDWSGAQEWTHCSIQQHKLKRCLALS